MTMPKTRGLGLIRLSKTADPASTSIPKQKEIIQTFADQQNIIIIGWAIDPATSAFHIPPEKRKQVREWMDKPDEYDCWVYWRQDRVVRRTEDFMGTVGWCRDNGKKLYSATEGLGDVTEHAGVLIGFITAWQAEGESRNTSKRVKDTRVVLKREGRWPGGRAPYWQHAVCICHDRRKCPEGKAKGWKLIIDEDRAPNIREAARRVTAGESMNAVTVDFNRRGVPTYDGKKPWKAVVLRDMLRNKNLMTGGLLTSEEWGQLQNALDARGFNRQIRTLGRDTLILDVMFCGHCGAKIYHWRNIDRKNNRDRTWGVCKNFSKRYDTTTPCKLMVSYTFLEEAVQADIKAHWDDIIETRVTNVARKMRSEEIDKELMSLTADMAAGRINRASFIDQQTALLDERDALEADDSGPQWHTTGETVGQRWERLSKAERRLWLLAIGTTYTVRREISEDGLRRRYVVESNWVMVGPGADTQPDELAALRRERVVRAASAAPATISPVAS